MRLHRVRVYAVDENGERYDYRSIVEASRAIGRSRRGIQQALHYGYRCAGYKWYHDPTQQVEEDRPKPPPTPSVPLPKVELQALLALVGDKHAPSLLAYLERKGVRRIRRSRKIWECFARWYVHQRSCFVPSDKLVALAREGSEGSEV